MHGKGCGKVCGEVFQSRGIKVEPGKETISNWQKKKETETETQRGTDTEKCAITNLEKDREHSMCNYSFCTTSLQNHAQKGVTLASIQ